MSLRTGQGASSGRVISRDQLGTGNENRLSLGGSSVKAMAEAAEDLAENLLKTTEKI